MSSLISKIGLDKLGRDISAVIWLGFSFLLGLCLYSYTPQDPSFHSTGSSMIVVNYCGYVGSFVSDLLYQFFGISSWSFVAIGLAQSAKQLRQSITESAVHRIIGVAFLILIGSSLVALHFPEIRIFGGEIYAGGLIGSAISMSLKLVLNFIGASVVLWSLALILLLYVTDRSLRFYLSFPMVLLRKIPLKVPQFEFKWPEMRLPNIWPRRGSSALENPAESVEFSKTVALPLNQARPSKALAEFSEPIAETVEESKSTKSKFELPQISIPKPKLNLFKSSVSSKGKAKRVVENWQLPKVSLLKDPPRSRVKIDEKEIKIKARLLVEKLEQFNVKGEIVGIKPGPAVTLFEFKPSIDVRLSKITELENDLSLALSSESVRIIAPIPGRDVVGIETANSSRETVFFKDILQDKEFWDESLKLPIVLGRKANGEPKVVDLRTMPHMLVAGSTGSGKSVFTVGAITGLIFRHSPKTLRFILIDPKQVDLAFFDNIPHLLMPPILEPKKAVAGLKWAVREMEKRYRSMKTFGTRKIEEYNEVVKSLPKQDIENHRVINEELEANKQLAYHFTELPYIVVVIEEFGDLMAVEKSNLEQQVVLLAQKARAAGIHLYLAMQSPRKDVVTGLIKTNIPGRVSFKVTNKMDSRIILDDSGAERLLAVGDMLYLSPGVSKPERHHGPYISNEEINEVSRFWCDQGEPEFDQMAVKSVEGQAGGGEFADEDGEDEYDEMYDRIVADIAVLKEVSASMLQRKYKIGYPRAARLVEIMEREGVVGPPNGSKPRQVLINSFE